MRRNMKTIFSIYLFLSFTLITGFSVWLQDQQKADQLVNSKKFVFHGRRALPMGGNSIDLTSNPNYVKFDPDLIDSYMPFFGRAYVGGYGVEGALHFKGTPEKFTIEEKKNGTYNVETAVKTQADYYRIFLTVSKDRSATLSINSNDRNQSPM